MTTVEKIKNLCAHKNMTLAALERELDFGQGSIRRWDERRPSADRLMEVADYFHVSIYYLMGKADPNDMVMINSEERQYIELLRRLDSTTRNHFLELLRATGKQGESHKE